MQAVRLVVVVRKLAFPDNPELGFDAIAETYQKWYDVSDHEVIWMRQRCWKNLLNKIMQYCTGDKNERKHATASRT